MQLPLGTRLALCRGMQPNPTYAGEIVEVSRRCEARAALLEPCDTVRALCAYLLAYYAGVHGIRLIAYCFMSTHYHLIFQDVFGHRAAFLRDLNRALAFYLNRYRGRVGRAFWDGRGPFCGRICDSETLIERVAYVSSNPVRHRAVQVRAAWRGARGGALDWDRPI